ncbi:MAG: addiction module protein [Kiritimatiellales bacterium]|nr:addiction module protein [Kiritimatiellales bacterium]
MSITEIKAMSRSEQLLAMEMLWDELCHQVQEPESPAWHKDVLDARQTKIAEGHAEYLTIDEVKKRLRP